MKFWKRGISCEEYVNLMSRYVDGDLSPEERLHWEEHFASCKGCNEFFQSFQSSIELKRYLRDQPCPRCVTERVHRLLEARLETAKQSKS